MNVTLLDFTKYPVDAISLAMGTSYGKYDTGEKRVIGAARLKHMSVFEFADATFRIEGISRACANQLVRHRLASYCQESQRYVKINTDSCDWYVTPDEIAENDDALLMYDKMMELSGETYKALLDIGIKPEDARYILPNGAKTTIVTKMNMREFFNFLNLRLERHAQAEIRYLAAQMFEALKTQTTEESNIQWNKICDLYTEYIKDF